MKCIVFISESCPASLRKGIVGNFLILTQSMQRKLGCYARVRGDDIVVVSKQSESASSFFIGIRMIVDSRIQGSIAGEVIQEIFDAVKVAAVSFAPDGVDKAYVSAELNFCGCFFKMGSVIIDFEKEANANHARQSRLYLLPS